MKVSTSQPYQEYQIPITSTASSAKQLTFPNGIAGFNRVEIEARGDNVVLNFGNASVVASATLTSNALPQGNFSLANGDTYTLDLDSRSQSFVSVISADALSTAGAIACIRVVAVNL